MNAGLQWIAHRGLTTVAPENTKAALIAALDASEIAGLELDVQMTADEVGIVFHDHELDRLTAHTGSIQDHSYRDIEDCRVQGHPIPTLKEILALPQLMHRRSPTLLNVELKASSRAPALIRTCREAIDRCMTHPNLNVVVSSFDPRVLLAAVQADVKWKLAFLYEDKLACSALKHFPDKGRHLDLHPHHPLIDEAHLAEYAEDDRVFRTWTVDCEVEAKRLASLDVNCMISNQPRALARAFAQETS